MPWVPIQSSEIPFVFAGGFMPAVTTLTDSVASFADAPYGGEWSITFESSQNVRITAQQYSSSYDPSQQYSYFYWTGGQQLNTAAAGFPGPGDVTEFTPTPFEITDITSFNYGFEGVGHSNNIETYSFLIEVWQAEEVEYKFSEESLVHELDKGWSFDGQYIPHFLELNWFFGEDPITYKSVSKIRIHGLTKGIVNLQVQLSGMQGDVATDYLTDYMQPEFLDLPFTPIHISSEFVPCTNYVDYSDRGLALQMKFEGRNTDITLPEPAHVIQVLALQSSPQGNGKTAN